METRESVIKFIQKQKTAFVASVDEDGFPNIKAMFTPRKIELFLFFHEYIIHACTAVFEKSKSKYLLL